MTPTIRIDEDVFEALQGHAEPLVDTPNSVLRRLLGLHEEAAAPADETRADASPQATRPHRRRRRRARTSSRRARAGSILSNEEYELPILQILSEKGDQAPTSEVLDALGERLNGRLTEADRETLDSGQIRWRNRAQFVRLRLVQRGDMVKDSPRGMWAITEQGERRAKGDV
jgi:hypothetical protein